MDRKVKLVVGTVGVSVLLSILAFTSLGATAEFVKPTDLADTDEYDGDVVKLEGRAVGITDGDAITFDVADDNHTVSVRYDGEMPETMSEGRLVVAEGVYDEGSVNANDLTIRAHEGEGELPDGYNKTEHSTNRTDFGMDGET